MKYYLSLVSVLASLALSGTAFGQDKSPDPAAPEKSDDSFPVAQETPEPSAYIKATHGAWEIRCFKPADVEECSLYKLLTDDTGNPTAELTIVHLPKGSEAKAGATLITPLGTLLTRGIAYSIDQDRARRYNFSWCDPGGCVARFGFTEQEIGFMEAGKAAVLTIVAVANQNNPIALQVPLDGFKAAWAGLTAE